MVIPLYFPIPHFRIPQSEFVPRSAFRVEKRYQQIPSYSAFP